MRRIRLNIRFAAVTALAVTAAVVCRGAASERRIPVDEWRDKMQAAWIGKMSGVGLGIATEFRYSHRIVPDSMMPVWRPETVNEGYNQDDMYLSLYSLRTLDRRGLDVSPREAYLDRADLQFEYGGRNRTMLEGRIAPPDLGHPHFKPTADGCGYTCGADYAGIVAPGLAAVPVAMTALFGSPIGYGDGLEAATFLGAMYCEAFFTEDMGAIVEKALRAIPSASLTSQAVRDVVSWHRKNAEWKLTWGQVMDKYWWNKENNWTEWPYGGGNKGINLDSKSMAAFTVMALLYGGGDFTRTMNIAIQASEDADCDASIACGILAASRGMRVIDPVYYSGLRRDVRFKYMSEGFDDLLSLTERVARRVVAAYGGRVETIEGREYFVVPASSPDRRKEAFVSSKTPGPIAGSVYSQQEMDRLNLLVDPGFENQTEAWSFYVSDHANHIVPLEGRVGLERFADNRARTGFNNVRLQVRYENQYRRAAQNHIFAGLRQTVAVEPGCRYRLSCWVKAEGGDERMAGRGSLSVKVPGGETLAEAKYGAKGDWTKVVVEFAAGDSKFVEVGAGFFPLQSDGTTFRYDDFTLNVLR